MVFEAPMGSSLVPGFQTGLCIERENWETKPTCELGNSRGRGQLSRE